MTREEAIKVLNMVEAHGVADEAKRMAIEALSEPSKEWDENREIIKDILQMMPTAYLLEALGVATFDELMDSERTGEWIFEKTDEYKRTYCSVCGGSAPFVCVSDEHYGRRLHGETRKTKFCPNCGAMMVEKDGEN